MGEPVQTNSAVRQAVIWAELQAVEFDRLMQSAATAAGRDYYQRSAEHLRTLVQEVSNQDTKRS